MQCSLTSSAQLSVHLTASEPQPAGAGVLIDAWTHLLRRTFYAATRPPEPTHRTATERDSDQPLLQRFVIPGTDLSTEAPTVGLELRHGYLIALYAIPPDEPPFTLTLKQKKPEPTIVQPDIPLQEAPGAPVTTQLRATLTDFPEPPYDYAWRADQEPHPRQNHGPTMTVTRTPTPTAATGEPQKLATVNLKVIDILGQVGEAEVDAMYYPAAEYQEKHQDGGKETAIGLSVGNLTAAVAQFYKKWKDRAKEKGAVLRVTGLAVAAAIVVAILMFMAFPRPGTPIAPSETGQTIEPPPSSPFTQPPQPPGPLPPPPPPTEPPPTEPPPTEPPPTEPPPTEPPPTDPPPVIR